MADFTEALVAQPAAPYIYNALFELDEARSTVHDLLTGEFDRFLKRRLLANLDAVERSLRGAL